MKKLIGFILADIAFVVISIILFEEHSFICGGLGITILGILLFNYYNHKK